MATFDLTIAQSLYDSNDRFPVDFDEAWRWLGYGRKNNALRAFLSNGFDEGTDFVVLLFNEQNSEASEGRPSQDYRLTVDCLKTFAMMAKTEAGKQVRRYFLQCEKLAKESAQTIELLQAEIAELKAISGDRRLASEVAAIWAELGPWSTPQAQLLTDRLIGQAIGTEPVPQEAVDPAVPPTLLLERLKRGEDRFWAHEALRKGTTAEHQRWLNGCPGYSWES